MGNSEHNPLGQQQLTEAETKYHLKILADSAQAEQMLAFIRKTEGARQSWSEFLTENYNLKPGDVVNNDGSITRKTDE